MILRLWTSLIEHKGFRTNKHNYLQGACEASTILSSMIDATNPTLRLGSYLLTLQLAERKLKKDHKHIVGENRGNLGRRGASQQV